MNQTSGPETGLAQATSLEEKAQALHARLCSLESVIVAYSGGVDSAYLAYAAHLALGPQMLAVIAIPPAWHARNLPMRWISPGNMAFPCALSKPMNWNGNSMRQRARPVLPLQG